MIRYKYYCHSKTGTELNGTIGRIRPIESLSERNELMTKIQAEVASIVYHANLPWDPFNVELLVRAQIRPKPQ